MDVRERDPEQAAVDQLRARDDVREALEQTVGKPAQAPVVAVEEKIRLGGHLLVLLGLVALFYLLRLQIVDIPARYGLVLQRLVLGAMATVVVLSAERVVKSYAIDRLSDAVTRYNLKRILRFVVMVVIGFIVLSVLFANWYTAVVSLGLISLILGFALQTPMTSFIGWIYILTRKPYRVGDRIRIGESTGDVIDVAYLDTTLWEFGGEYLSTEHPSGRLIKFPNSVVLTQPVYNYSWPLFPYVWNEIKFHIAYDSDLEFVERTMREEAEAELGEAMMERVRVFRQLLAETPVDQLEVRERPAVFFRVNTNSWLDAICRYVVEPRRAGRVKTTLIRKMLDRLNAEPDRVKFPKGAAR
ncbi:MAG TPA: mechanosensitive ion channel domain-containing protein [bacterium]|jgi:small-conductance mechanosensitive channel|nr:mechanosensitive ion channel domain-containing protein [bacterium]